jgi:hypothetical protein
MSLILIPAGIALSNLLKPPEIQYVLDLEMVLGNEAKLHV